MHKRTKLWYLKNLGVFENLSDHERETIISHTVGQDINKGDVLYFQGSADENVYLLKSGVVKLTKLTPGGNELTLDILSRGTVFGEMTNGGEDGKDETAVVLEDGYICTINRADFELITSKMPELTIKIIKMGRLKSKKIENKLMGLLYRTVEQRLAVTLINLVSEFGTPYNGGGHIINIKLTHKDYADLIASTRETVTNAMNRLKEKDLIETKSKYIIVKNIDKLKELIN